MGRTDSLYWVRVLRAFGCKETASGRPVLMRLSKYL
jgi:hypothetical protein